MNTIAIDHINSNYNKLVSNTNSKTNGDIYSSSRRNEGEVGGDIDIDNNNYIDDSINDDNDDDMDVEDMIYPNNRPKVVDRLFA